MMLKKVFLIKVLVLILFVSCNQKKNNKIKESVHQIVVNDSLIINDFTFYKDLLLSDDNKYPRTK